MKKIIISSVIILILSGCQAGSPGQVTEKNNVPPSDQEAYDTNGIINRITAIKNGLTPKLKPSKNPAASTTKSPDQTGQQASQQQQVTLEPLAEQYNRALIKTNLGNIKVAFYAQESPLTVNNFLNLAQKGFYDGTKFHRVVKDFMLQGGDPNSRDDNWDDDGQGGPGYRFQDEINDHKLVRGSLAMANSGANTNGSQFFLVTAEAAPWLDGQHTNFGYVVEGMETVAKIEAAKVNENDHPLEDIVIQKIELLSE